MRKICNNKKNEIEVCRLPSMNQIKKIEAEMMEIDIFGFP